MLWRAAMKNYENVCYKANFINQVIFRIDFLRYLSQDIVFSEEVENAIVRYFPKRGMDQIVKFNDINLVLDSNNGQPSASSKTIEGIQKVYTSNTGNKVILTNMFLAFEIHKYTLFDEHMRCFKDVLFELFAKRKVISKRAGLRYINIFDASKHKLQKRYFNNDIAATLISKQTVDTDSINLVRSMHINEYRTDNAILNFRYGMYNPDYPNYLENHSFVLDYDCYSEEMFDNADLILRFVDFAHDMIQTLFENSISDALRQVMQNE